MISINLSLWTFKQSDHSHGRLLRMLKSNWCALFEWPILTLNLHLLSFSIHQWKRARPIHKLCEFEGNLPEVYEPDCYKDVDESDYACKEKYRIMVSITKSDQISLSVHKLIWFLIKTQVHGAVRVNV